MFLSLLIVLSSVYPSIVLFYLGWNRCREIPFLTSLLPVDEVEEEVTGRIPRSSKSDRTRCITIWIGVRRVLRTVLIRSSSVQETVGPSVLWSPVLDRKR